MVESLKIFVDILILTLIFESCIHRYLQISLNMIMKGVGKKNEMNDILSDFVVYFVFATFRRDSCFYNLVTYTGHINVICCLTKESKSHEKIFIQRQPIQWPNIKRQKNKQ